MSNVLIMMATYNGEEYLPQQLDSIISQTFKEWTLAIQDDGSTDRTWDILNEYSQRDKRIRLYRNECGFHGAFYNFHALANRFKNGDQYQYYLFSDQDDIWLKTKVETLINEIKKCREESPAVVYADMGVCDKNGKQVNESLDKLIHIRNRNKHNIFFNSKVYGCNMIMNKAAFFCVPYLIINEDFNSRLAHDGLYSRVSAFLGEIVFFPGKTMLYRRHGENVTSYVHYETTLSRVIHRIFHLKWLASKHASTYSQSITALELLKQKDLSTRDHDLLNEIECCFTAGGFAVIKYIVKYRVDFGRPIETISRSLILILGLHRKYLNK